MSFLFYPGFVRSSTESGSCDHVLWCGTSPCCVHSWAQTCWCHPQPLCMLTRSSHECLLTVEFCHSFILFAKVQLFGLSKYCSLFKRQTCILFHVQNKNLSISFFFFFYFPQDFAIWLLWARIFRYFAFIILHCHEEEYPSEVSGSFTKPCIVIADVCAALRGNEGAYCWCSHCSWKY